MKGNNATVKRGKITGVSLGPGDPDLITVKGLKLLKAADKIYYPGSEFKDGRKDSYSLSILQYYGLDPEKLTGFYLKMSLDRAEAESMYQSIALQLVNDHSQGLDVVIVSEGDASTYSSFSYLLTYLKNEKVEVDLIPGITSYALAAAYQTSPLCLQNEKVMILPRVQSEVELEQCLKYHDTVVLMKIRIAIPTIVSVLEKHHIPFFYGERLGTAQEFTCTDLSVIKRRKIPYFSLMILKNRRNAIERDHKEYHEHTKDTKKNSMNSVQTFVNTVVKTK